MGLECLALTRDTRSLETLQHAAEKLSIKLEVCRGVNSGGEVLMSEKYDGVIIDCDDLQGGLELLGQLRKTASNNRSMPTLPRNVGIQGPNQGRRLGAPAEMIGPPFRMLLAFHEPDEERRILMRTLVQQELLQRGVLTLMGFMVPSFAHDGAALSETLDAFEHALRILVEAAADDSFARRLEIPPINAL